jgi:hypothetical protein
MREVIARLVNAQQGLDIVVAGSTHDDADFEYFMHSLWRFLGFWPQVPLQP